MFEASPSTSSTGLFAPNPPSVPSLKRSVSSAPWLVITLLIALSSPADLNRALLLPFQLIESQLDFLFKDGFHKLAVRRDHSSTSMSSLPSMIAIRLSHQP